MDLDPKHQQKINEYLASKGIVDPDINLELSDHLYSILEQEKLESELIPPDILSEERFDKYEFHKTYQELIKIKKNNLMRSKDIPFYRRHDIAFAFILLIIHRIIFFVCLPQMPPKVYAPFESLAMTITAIFYFGIGAFFVFKAIKLAKH